MCPHGGDAMEEGDAIRAAILTELNQCGDSVQMAAERICYCIGWE